MQNFKHIHIGSLIQKQVERKGISISRIVKFFHLPEEAILKMYEQESIDVALLLKWCKLLEYNFFLYYHSHLQLYSPDAANIREDKSMIPFIRKNIYTEEVKRFFINEIEQGKISPSELMKKFHIPKTTVYRWLRKKEQPEVEKKNSSQMASPDYKKIYTHIHQNIHQNKPLPDDLQNRIKNTKKNIDVLEVDRI